MNLPMNTKITISKNQTESDSEFWITYPLSTHKQLGCSSFHVRPAPKVSQWPFLSFLSWLLKWSSWQKKKKEEEIVFENDLFSAGIPRGQTDTEHRIGIMTPDVYDSSEQARTNFFFISFRVFLWHFIMSLLWTFPDWEKNPGVNFFFRGQLERW